MPDTLTYTPVPGTLRHYVCQENGEVYVKLKEGTYKQSSGHRKKPNGKRRYTLCLNGQKVSRSHLSIIFAATLGEWLFTDQKNDVMVPELCGYFLQQLATKTSLEELKKLLKEGLITSTTASTNS